MRTGSSKRVLINAFWLMHNPAVALFEFLTAHESESTRVERTVLGMTDQRYPHAVLHTLDTAPKEVSLAQRKVTIIPTYVFNTICAHLISSRSMGAALSEAEERAYEDFGDEIARNVVLSSESPVEREMRLVVQDTHGTLAARLQGPYAAAAPGRDWNAHSIEFDDANGRESPEEKLYRCFMWREFGMREGVHYKRSEFRSFPGTRERLAREAELSKSSNALEAAMLTAMDDGYGQ